MLLKYYLSSFHLHSKTLLLQVLVNCSMPLDYVFSETFIDYIINNVVYSFLINGLMWSILSGAYDALTAILSFNFLVTFAKFCI